MGARIRTLTYSFGDCRAQPLTLHPRKNGLGSRIRTYDPLLPKQMRYQAALYREWLFTCTYLHICRCAHGDETSPPNIVFLSQKIVCTISSTFVSPKKFMVGLGRLELPTSRLSGERSNQLSYRPMLAGAVGFEPTVHCTKNSCLTTWLRSSN